MLTNISIIIPAKNEETNLPQIIPALFRRYGKNILEIIVVNNHSTDRSEEVLASLNKRYPKLKVINRHSQPGVGLAIRTGIKNLSPKTQYVLFMDCDFLVNVPDIAKMLKKIAPRHLKGGRMDSFQVEEFDGIIGSRFLRKNSLKNYPLMKRLVNRLYHLLARVLLGVKQKDLTNNFKLYKKELVDRLYPITNTSHPKISIFKGHELNAPSNRLFLRGDTWRDAFAWAKGKHRNLKKLGVSLKIGIEDAKLRRDPLLSSNDFAINAELGFYPVLMGYKIGEIPVVWKERTQHMGLSKFKILRVGPSYFKVFLKLLFLKHKMSS